MYFMPLWLDYMFIYILKMDAPHIVHGNKISAIVVAMSAIYKCTEYGARDHVHFESCKFLPYHYVWAMGCM